jgi:alpha-galactosidase
MTTEVVCPAFVFGGQIKAQKSEGFALTPPRGWNSWNTVQTQANEQLVKDIADKMVSSGMKDAGYPVPFWMTARWLKKEKPLGNADNPLVATIEPHDVMSLNL